MRGKEREFHSTLSRKNFGERFNYFLKSHDRFGPAFHLYLGVHRQEGLYVEHKFANLIWGLEALHRRGSILLSNSALQAKIDRVLQQISRPSDRKWLKRTLSARTEPSLEDRIFELFSNLPLNIDNNKLKEFSRRCARRRNDLSHFGGVRERRDEYSDFVLDIMHLSNALGILYHAKILQEIGIENDHIKDAVCNGLQSFYHKAVLEWVGIPFT